MACELCQKPALLLCTGCRCAYYCCDDHQKTAWASVHSKVCRLVGALGSARAFCTLEERRQRDETVRQQKLRIMQTSIMCGTRHIFSDRPGLAMPAAKQALTMAAEVFGASSVELIRPFLMLASACVLLGELNSAEGYLSQGEWTLIYAKSEDHALRAWLFRGWGQLLAARREWVQAKWCCAEDVHHCAEAFGPQDVRCTLGYFRLAESLLQMEKFDIVSSLFRQIVTIWQQYFYGEVEEGEVPHRLSDPEVIEALHVLTLIRKSFTSTGDDAAAGLSLAAVS
ncbi:zinc finger MYND domain-containing protein 12-like [Pollicipes pollicipes]|uniref:zinc finger MYND domain-containing protein 12-like n=1 Tax=Pollicipes pollicipes TaxID=41117 RepID=UPI0018854B05|nr:zinc finger MYND domain-containing protein 12-like [Pollicipes pollicipes]